MIILSDLRVEAVNCRKDVKELYSVLKIDEAKKELADLRKQSEKTGFWDDIENSQKVMQKTKQLENKIESFKKFSDHLEDIIAMIDLTLEDGGSVDDEETANEINADFEKFKKELSDKQLETLLTGEYDSKNAILTFHAGAGGTEAQDWTEMLYRMYVHWAEQHGYKHQLLDWLDGDGAGAKSCTMIIEGENVYGYLKGENGVHRLVRVSPFDSQGRRHTSFAAVEVMPEIDDSIEVDIRPEDLKIDTYRASGAGGQHINKTESAVRITHIPTGVVVSCQTQRSQMQNKDYAMKMLRSELIKIKEQEHAEKISDIKGVQKKIEWGSQIRSYVFMPYTLVKDHRTNYENGNVNAVMNGDIDGFIHAYLKSLQK